MKRTLIALLMVLTLTGCTTQAQSEESFSEVSDSPEPSHIKITVVKEGDFPTLQVALGEKVLKVPERQAEPISDEVLPEDEYLDEYVYQEWDSGSESSGYYFGNPDGLNTFDGTFPFGGHLETYYGEYAAYDNELWVDEEGFFRDDQGRYVVSSSDYNKYDEIQISKGTAVVRDDGTAPGVVDVHVVWGR